MIETYHKYAEVIRRDREQRARVQRDGRARGEAVAAGVEGPTMSIPEEDDSDGARWDIYELEQKVAIITLHINNQK